MSMGYNMAKGTSGMLKAGHTSTEGLDEAVLRNIEAGYKLSQMVCSSMGPNGMNKLVVNHLSKIIVTSDCATLVKELEVDHPAASMLSLASQMQDQEYGDGTNLTVTLAGNLLKQAAELLAKDKEDGDKDLDRQAAEADNDLDLVPGAAPLRGDAKVMPEWRTTARASLALARR